MPSRPRLPNFELCKPDGLKQAMCLSVVAAASSEQGDKLAPSGGEVPDKVSGYIINQVRALYLVLCAGPALSTLRLWSH